MDDKNVLLIEELVVGGSSLRELKRAGRFLKSAEIAEWYNFDFKLKSISLEFSNYKDGGYVAYLNQN